MADLNTEIKIGADASGVEAGVTKAKRSLKDLGAAAQQAGKDAGAGMASVGAGGDQAAKKVDSATRGMQNSLQRLIAEQKAGGKASREYYEALADTKGISRGAIKPLLDQLDAAKAKTLSAESAAKSWKSSITSIGPAIAAAFSVAAITGVVGKVVAVQREFDVLNSSLKTVTGSSAAAERELMWLKTFAKETPFGLAQATQGFIKMKSLGLDPTRAALTSFGNTASAMGKDLNQIIEAVADASTGEFERLKEFGIKAKKEGDNVALTFQGVTKTIGNNAAEINKYLQSIGDTQFAGAMEERAKTLDGTIAALGDTWDELFRTVSTNNVGGFIFDSVTLANGAIEDATTILKAMGGAASDAGKGTGALATIQSGLATVFETVAVVGANVKYVLTQVGNEVDGLAAQVAQAAQFNFSGVAAIRAQMVADAQAARKEIDATTDRILNARKEQERFASYATRNASAATDPRRLDVGGSTAGVKGLKATAKAVKAAVTEYDKLIKKLGEDIPKAAADAEAAQMGYNKAQTEFLALARSPEWAKFTSGQRANVAALFATKIASEQAGDAITSLAKAQKEFEASRQKEIGSHLKEIEALGEKAQKLEDEVKYYGMSQEAIESLTTARMLDQIEVLRGMDNSAEEIARIEETIAARKRLAAAGTAKDSKVAAEKYADDMLKEQKKAAEESSKYWEDALMRAFESGKGFFESLWDTIKNTLKTQVLKVTVQGVMGSLGVGAAGAANAGGDGITGLAGTANTISSLYSGASSLVTVGSQVLAGTMSAANALGTIAANATGTGISGLLATNAAYGTAAGTAAGAAAGAGASAGAFAGVSSALAAVPVWGWAALAGLAVLGMSGGPTSTRSTGYANRQYGSDGTLLSSSTDANGIGEAGGVLDSIYKSIAGVQASLGATGGADITYNSNTGRESADPQFYLKTGSYDSGEIQKNDANVSLAISRTILTAIQDSELPKYLQGAFDGMVAGSMSQAQINAAITDGQALKLFNDQLLALPFANLADLSFAATQNLIGFSGGLDQLKTNLGSYYTNFYSAEEQRAQTVKNINAATAGSGLDAATATRESFRALVDNAMLDTSEAGLKTTASLLAVSGALGGVITAAEQAAAAAAQLAKTNQSWQDQIDVLNGTETSRSIALRDAGDVSTRALMEVVYGLQDLAATADAAAAAAAQLASTNQGIQDQIDLLTGAQTERSLQLRDASDETTKALLKQLYAQQDLKEAVDIAPVVNQAVASLNNLGDALGRFGESLNLRADAFAPRTSSPWGEPRLTTPSGNLTQGWGTNPTSTVTPDIYGSVKASEGLRELNEMVGYSRGLRATALALNQLSEPLAADMAVFDVKSLTSGFNLTAAKLTEFFTDLGTFGTKLEAELATANDTAIGSALNLVSISQYFADLATEMVDIQTELGRTAALAGGGLSLDAVTSGFAGLIGSASTGVSEAITASLLDKVPEAIRNDPALAGVSTAILGIVGAVKKDDVQGLNDSFLLLSGALTRGELSSVQYRAAIKFVTEAFKTGTEAAKASAESIEAAYKRLRDAAKTNEQIAQEKISLEDRLSAATDTTAQALERARNAIDPYNRALYDTVLAAESAKEQSLKRAELERQILDLSGDTAAIRLLEIAGMDAANVALYDRIDALKKEASVTQERNGLMTSLYGALGNTGALRAEQLAKLDPSNRALQSQIFAIEDAKSALEKAMQAEADSAQAAQQAAQERVSTIQSIFDTLKSNVDDLYDSVEATKAFTAAQGNAFIDNALSNARATGYLPEGVDLTDAISGARGGLDKQYASEFERQRDTLVLAGKLAELQDISGGQLTVAEQQLKAAENQVSAIQQQGQALLDSLSGNTTATLSIVDAIAQLSAAVLGAGSAAPAGATAIAGGGGAAGGLSESQIIASNTQRFAGIDMAKAMQDGLKVDGLQNQLNSFDQIGGAAMRAAMDSGMGYGIALSVRDAAIAAEVAKAGLPSDIVSKNYEALFGAGAGTDLYRTQLADIVGVGEDWKKLNDLPGFATGGMHSGGLRWVGENGPELEATGPSRIWNAQQLSGAMGGGNTERLESLIEGLTNRVASLQAELVAIKTNTGQMAEQIDEVTEGGNAIRSRAVGVAA